MPLIIFQRDSGVPHVGELADVVPPVKFPQILAQILPAPMVVHPIVAAFQYSKIPLNGVGGDANAVLSAHIFLGIMVYLRVFSFTPNAC